MQNIVRFEEFVFFRAQKNSKAIPREPDAVKSLFFFRVLSGGFGNLGVRRSLFGGLEQDVSINMRGSS